MDNLCRSCGHLCDEFVSINEEVDVKHSSFIQLSTMMTECVDIDVRKLNNIKQEYFISSFFNNYYFNRLNLMMVYRADYV